MPDTKTILVHVLCVAVIGAMFALSQTVLKPQPILGLAAVAAGFFLWGKLGFKPAQSIFEKLVAKLEPSDVLKIVSSRPPATEKVIATLAVQADQAHRPPLIDMTETRPAAVVVEPDKPKDG